MKKELKGFLVGASTMAVLMGGLTFAANRSETVERFFRDIKIKLNGTEITPKDATGKVVEPFIIDGTTYLPVRAVGEAMGLNVDWDNDTSTVLLNDSQNVQLPYFTELHADSMESYAPKDLGYFKEYLIGKIKVAEKEYDVNYIAKKEIVYEGVYPDYKTYENEYATVTINDGNNEVLRIGYGGDKDLFVYKDKYIIIHEPNMYVGNLEFINIYDSSLKKIDYSTIHFDWPSYFRDGYTKIPVNAMYDNCVSMEGDKIIYKCNKNDGTMITSELTEQDGVFTSTIIDETTEGYEVYAGAV